MNANPSGGFRIFPFLFTAALIVGGVMALYYLYTALYGSASTLSVKLLQGPQQADQPVTGLPSIPQPFEGGEYSVNMWMYINSFNVNRSKRKHVFELRGTNFSTLLVGLGAFRNTLHVRAQTADPTATTPASGATSLKPADRTSFFGTIASDDSITDVPICDLPEIDMQRWVMVTVVLDGKTIDVYVNGKLKRSCATPSYFRVDPTGVTPVLCDGGGFDGHIAGVGVSKYGLNPEEIYKLYLSGPEGSTWDIGKWLGSLFTGGV
jgi:hypothetical protein